jgi:competence protein ComEA
MSSPPPPFVLQPDGWRGRLERLLDGVGRQRLAIAVLVLLALTAAGLLRLHAVPHAADPATAAPASGGGAQALPRVAADAGRDASANAGSASTATGEIAVDVVGRVRRPGLVRLPAGSRVVDAITAAGGAATGAVLEAVNLARKVVDGEQIRVPRQGEPLTAPAAVAGATGSAQPGAPDQPGVPLDLNTATLEQLETLPGVGEVTARRIVEYREAHPFTAVEDLRQVQGIGDRRFEALKDLVTVAGGR